MQSMHWHTYQISNFMHITFWHNPNVDLYEEDSHLLAKIIFMFFDDKRHHSQFVQHCYNLHWDHMHRRWVYATMACCVIK
jgi:predicted GH43/DUF377 family glycosyl hydrolase